MNIRQYLDSTYLKTASQAGLTETENRIITKGFIQEAIDENYKLIMVRPDMVSMANIMINDSNSSVQIGTVVDFPGGNSGLEIKRTQAIQAICNGADDLDFVCNYEAFKAGNVELVKNEILSCTQLGLANNKVVKWIIEVAALSDKQIIQISALIKNLVITHFKEEYYSSVFVKSSTGFYQTENQLPNGATFAAIIMMLENANPLPIKAAGGIRTFDDAVEMIRLGVKRIGTSAAKAIANGQQSHDSY
jgi:deoxyribose-phosphate aldolase